MTDDEVEEYVRQAAEDFKSPRKKTPIGLRVERQLSVDHRVKGSKEVKKIGYDELVDAERSRLKRIRSSPIDSDEEDERISVLKREGVASSVVVERQQRELDYYSNKAKSH